MFVFCYSNKKIITRIKMVKKQSEDFEEGTPDSDIYNKGGEEELVEDDEISDAEEGFMEGFEHGEHQVKCAECKKILTDLEEDEIIEEEINNETYRFCSKECADAFETTGKSFAA